MHYRARYDASLSSVCLATYHASGLALVVSCWPQKGEAGSGWKSGVAAGASKFGLDVKECWHGEEVNFSTITTTSKGI